MKAQEIEKKIQEGESILTNSNNLIVKVLQDNLNLIGLLDKGETLQALLRDPKPLCISMTKLLKVDL